MTFATLSSPFLIGICGAPKAGKSTLQQLLTERYGLVAADDGRPLRDACKVLYNLTEDQVTTQAGKASFVTVLGSGERVQVRKLLGDIGVYVEQQHGPDFIPASAIEAAKAKHPGAAGFSFGSVRRQQGRVYRAAGGFIVEVVMTGKPAKDGVEVGYDFDAYDRSFCQATLENVWGQPEALVASAIQLFDQLLPAAKTAA